jgi:hypothetical protein
VLGPRAEHRDHASVWLDDRVACGEDLLGDLGKRHFLVSSKAEEAGAIRPGLLLEAAS